MNLFKNLPQYFMNIKFARGSKMVCLLKTDVDLK